MVFVLSDFGRWSFNLHNFFRNVLFDLWLSSTLNGLRILATLSDDPFMYGAETRIFLSYDGCETDELTEAVRIFSLINLIG